MSKKQSKATKQGNAQRAAERAAAIRREDARRQRRRRTVVVGAAVFGVLTVIVGIALVVQSTRDTTGQATTPPNGVVATFGIPLGRDAAPVTVEVYEDFMCPFCGQFEAAAGKVLKEYAASGGVQVQYKAVAYLDRFSNGSDYSTRAMNAVGVVLDEAGREAALAMHDALYANQPAEDTTGLSDDELVDLAGAAGADPTVVEGPIKDRKFEQWVTNANDEANKNGVTGTPTVLVDGETVEFRNVEELLANTKSAVDSALAE